MKYGIGPLFLQLFIFLCAPAHATFDASKLSGKSRRLVIQIEKENLLMGSAVGAGGIRPEQYNRFEKLKATVSLAELTELTNHPNGVVRCYAFWALAYHPTANLFPLVCAHLDDTAMVNTMFGCIVGSEKAGDIFVNLVTPGYVDTDIKKLDSVQRAQLDSILIATASTLDIRDLTIYESQPTAQLYPVLRKLVAEDQNCFALVPLSRYRKAEDVPLLLHSLQQLSTKEEGYYYAYEAVRNFPHPVFFPVLEQRLTAEWNKAYYGSDCAMLYYAIAAYQNEQANTLLQNSLVQVSHSSTKAHHVRFAVRAMSTFKCPAYDAMLWRFWREERCLESGVFTYLAAKDTQAVLAESRKTLVHAGDYDLWAAKEDGVTGKAGKPLLTLLDFVLQQDRQSGLQIIREHIKEANVRRFALFADKAGELKDTSFIIPLLDLVNNDNNPYTYLKAAEVLLSYKDAAVNRQLADARRKKQGGDWGGRAFRALLEKKAIR